METPPRLVRFGRGHEGRSLCSVLAKGQDLFQARVMNSAFNFVSVAFCLNDGHENSAEGCGLNPGMNRENRDFCL